MIHYSKPELLAPAGSEDCLYAAVENGADAVYFGLAGSASVHNTFNARVRASNIPFEKLGGTMDFLHRRGVRGYVTLNTLVRNDELPAIETLLTKIADCRVDAVLVQDFGIAKLARKLCPDLTLHASTQMSLTSIRGIELAESLGIRRVVLPRELSLKQIRDIRKKTAVELECFVHGALCISFSGQCYASLGLGGRSSNRGCCAQPCRLPYTMIDAEQSTESEISKQLLSPCDLAALPILPQLIATGVRALKIEGRLKPPEYVAEVTRIYRQAIDEFDSRIIDTESQSSNSEAQIERLELTFSRGFSTGWLEGVNPHQLVPGNVMSHRGSLLGTVIEVRRDAVVVKLSAPVRRGDGVLFENEMSPEHSQGGRVYEIIRGGESVMETVGGIKVLLTFANDSINADYVTQNQTVRKTDDPRLQREIRKNLESHKPSRRIPLDLTVRAVAGEPIQIDVQNSLGASFHLQGENNLEAARKHPLSVDVLREQFDRLGETIYRLEKLEAVIEGSPMVPLSVLGGLRREMIEKLDAYEPASAKPMIAHNALEFLRNENKTLFGSNTGNRLQTGKPTLHFLLRDVRLFKDDSFLKRILASGCRSFYAELREMDEFQIAADAVRRHGAEFVAVLPRILKPGEPGILKKFAALQPDAVLARNLEEIAFFREQNTPIIADFSFNIINELSFRQLLDWGAERMTLGWDLDEKQADELLQRIPAEKTERIVAGRMPLFTMEHCLWRANLVRPDEPCRQICQTHPLQLKDRRGALHPVRSDMFCRNFVENAEPVEIKATGQHLRIEWDNRLGHKQFISAPIADEEEATAIDKEPR